MLAYLLLCYCYILTTVSAFDNFNHPVAGISSQTRPSSYTLLYNEPPFLSSFHFSDDIYSTLLRVWEDSVQNSSNSSNDILRKPLQELGIKKKGRKKKIVNPQSILSIIENFEINASSEHLCFKNNILKQIPDNLLFFKKIKIINFSNNKIAFMNFPFEELKNLTELNLSGNLIQSIPENFKKCGNIKILNLSCNPITKFDAWIFLLNLEDLDFSSLQELRKISNKEVFQTRINLPPLKLNLNGCNSIEQDTLKFLKMITNHQISIAGLEEQLLESKIREFIN